VAQRDNSALPGSLISVPLYGQVIGVLRQRIIDGGYEVGEQLPPEDRLAAEFAVSRATVRQAVGELVRQGFVERKQGRGTFVLESRHHQFGQRFSGSLGEFIAETVRSKARKTEVDRHAQIPVKIAEWLRIDEPVAMIVRRTRALQNQNFAYTVNYVPDRYGELITETELRRTGLMALLASKGVRFGHAQQIIRAEQADIEVCERLQMDFAAPVLYAQRMVYSEDDEPVQFVRSWYRADLYEYQVNLVNARTDETDGAVRFDLG
jgi:GntR family transcriptional regulator